MRLGPQGQSAENCHQAAERNAKHQRRANMTDRRTRPQAGKGKINQFMAREQLFAPPPGRAEDGDKPKRHECIDAAQAIVEYANQGKPRAWHKAFFADHAVVEIDVESRWLNPGGTGAWLFDFVEDCEVLQAESDGEQQHLPKKPFCREPWEEPAVRLSGRALPAHIAGLEVAQAHDQVDVA